MTDPDYADTYINLCKIYGRIGAEKGDEYFKKAEKSIEKYRQLRPEDYDGYQDEKTILEAMKEKYKIFKDNEIYGTWSFAEMKDTNGSLAVWFPYAIKISKSNDVDIFFRFDGPERRVYNNKTFKNIKYDNETDKTMVARIIDEPEYGEYHVGRGSITDHDILVKRDWGYGSYGGVSGYYDSYRFSKYAVMHESITQYTIEFSNGKIIVRLRSFADYIDKNGNPIFYQNGINGTPAAIYIK